jgi:hypothetical protein
MLDGLAHDNLSLASSVVFRGVEEVDTQIVRLLHASKRLLILGVTSVGHPATESDSRNM